MVIPLPVEEQCRGVLSEPLPNLQLLTGEGVWVWGRGLVFLPVADVENNRQIDLSHCLFQRQLYYLSTIHSYSVAKLIQNRLQPVWLSKEEKNMFILNKLCLWKKPSGHEAPRSKPILTFVWAWEKWQHVETGNAKCQCVLVCWYIASVLWNPCTII